MSRKNNLIYLVRVAVLLVPVGAAAVAFVAKSSDAASIAKNAKSIRYVANKDYEEECAPCHIGFLPGFLPQRSWKALMAGLEDHFGENASLDEDVQKNISKYLLTNAADSKKSTRRSKQIAKLMDKSDKQIRITKTPFWIRKHYSVKRYVWEREKVGSKAKCDSCHKEAAKGLYSEYDVQIPQ